MTFDLSKLHLPDQRGDEVTYLAPVRGRVAHIDADFMAYQVSAETRDELDGIKPRRTLNQMKHNTRRGLEHLMRECGAESYVAHITPSGSNKGGRADAALTKEYQGNRKDKVKPEHLETIRTFIGQELPSRVWLDREADDGMAAANYDAVDPNLSVIVSKDKDLRMVSGLHWDFDEEILVSVDDDYGDIWIDRTKKSAKVLGWGTKFFWAQLLMGDTADNIAGLPCGPDGKKVGPIAAHSLLEDCTSDYQCFQVIKYLWSQSTHTWTNYRDDSPTTWKQNLVADMKLLWMRRTEDENDVFTWLKEI